MKEATNSISMKKLFFLLTPLPLLLFACAGLSEIMPGAMLDPPDEVRDWAGSFTPGDPTATPPGEDITDNDYLKGKEAYWNDENEEAIRLMTLVLERDPNLAPAYWYRSMATANLGHYREALPDMEKALELDPNYALAYADRGYIYANIGDNDRAVKDYRTAIMVDPSLAKAQHNIAVYYFETGNYEAALQQYQYTLRIDPGRAISWLGLAGVYSVYGMFQECIDHATTAIVLFDEKTLILDKKYQWNGYYTRGTCKMHFGDYEGAIQDLDIYLENVPDDVLGWINRGASYDKAGNYNQAIADYDRAIAIDPSHPFSYLNKGAVYNRLGEYEAAVEQYTLSLSVAEVPRAHVGRGESYINLGLYDEAIADFQRALQLVPNYKEVHGFLAWAYIEQGRYQEALDSARKAISLGIEGSNLKVAIEICGRAHYGLGNYEDALSDLHTSMRMEPTVMGHYYRGLVFQAMGKYEKAEYDFEMFLSNVDPEHQDLIDEVNQRLEEIRKYIDD